MVFTGTLKRDLWLGPKILKIRRPLGVCEVSESQDEAQLRGGVRGGGEGGRGVEVTPPSHESTLQFTVIVSEVTEGMVFEDLSKKKK